jgi:hypothetical protein
MFDPEPPKRGPQYRRFTPDEDAVIIRAKFVDPSESWDNIAKRLEGRWRRFLAPRKSSEPWTPEEDQLLVDKVNEIGKAWAAMKLSFQGRSPRALSNRWNCHIKS